MPVTPQHLQAVAVTVVPVSIDSASLAGIRLGLVMGLVLGALIGFMYGVVV